ncbi:MAG: EamA family transporter [Bacteroidetes bacterium]|nr:EamA family transporter [Bacteroidota bacterium]
MVQKIHKSTAITLIAILAVVWGSSFILMKKGLEVYTWDQVGSFRMLVSFVVLFPFVWKRFKEIDSALWKFILISGICGNGIPSYLFPLAETRIDSALAGIINSLTPLFTLLVGLLFFGSKLSSNRVAGVLIGLVGAVMIILARSKGIISGNVAYSLFVVISTLCYAFSVNVLRHRLTQVDAILISGFALMFAGIPSGIYLFTTDFISRTQHADGAVYGLLAIVVLAVFGTAISTFLFNKLIKISSALFASSVTYLIPFVAILWGIGFGERIVFLQLVGLGAILSGVYMINRK